LTWIGGALGAHRGGTEETTCGSDLQGPCSRRGEEAGSGDGSIGGPRLSEETGNDSGTTGTRTAARLGEQLTAVQCGEQWATAAATTARSRARRQRRRRPDLNMAVMGTKEKRPGRAREGLATEEHQISREMGGSGAGGAA
jgi:hypothetical protein